MKCEVCGQEFKSVKGLGSHIKKKHKIEAEDYYNQYLKENEQEGYCLTCGGKTSFRGMSIGYSTFCSGKCQMDQDEYRKISSESRKKFWREDPRTDEVKNKISESVKERWNEEDSVFNSNEYRNKLSESQSERWNREKEDYIDYVFPSYGYELLDEKYYNAFYYHNWRCANCNYIFVAKWCYIREGKQCPNCQYTFGKPTSKMERELAIFLSNLGLNVRENSKRIIPPQELDIYIPEFNIGIELNGLYWHSDDKKDKNYHLNKTELCEERRIQLIHIFEDEWMFKQDIVKENIKEILGVNRNYTYVKPEDCVINEINSKTKNEFLENFHIEGKDNSVVKLGSFYNNNLVSVMTFAYNDISKGVKSNKDVWKIRRFCTNYNYNTPGIENEFLNYFKENYKWKSIFVYIDRRWGGRSLYEKLGFKEVNRTEPNYWYVDKYRRIHRFKLRKGNNKGNLSEQTIRRNEGYSVIWDCGNIKFELTK